MSKGILIYAHNNESIDYVALATVSAKLAKKNLNCPVSLVTDKNSSNFLNDSTVFDKILIVDKPADYNKRKLDKTVVSFLNFNRNTAWDITPYDQTLLIDADYFVFTDKLSEFWNIDQSFLISNTSNFYIDNKSAYLNHYIGLQGIPMKWATTIIFTKNLESKLYFDLVEYIKQEYYYFSLIYKFNPRMYRNDIAFSIADHILNGHLTVNRYSLPNINALLPEANILKLDLEKGCKFMINNSGDNYVINVLNSDIHFMNKSDLIKNLNF
jgi:hypothetical protein